MSDKIELQERIEALVEQIAAEKDYGHLYGHRDLEEALNIKPKVTPLKILDMTNPFEMVRAAQAYQKGAENLYYSCMDIVTQRLRVLKIDLSNNHGNGYQVNHPEDQLEMASRKAQAAMLRAIEEALSRTEQTDVTELSSASARRRTDRLAKLAALRGQSKGMARRKKS